MVSESSDWTESGVRVFKYAYMFIFVVLGVHYFWPMLKKLQKEDTG